jgi:hypothetical protein
MAITGLSMAAHAHPVSDPTEIAKALNFLGTRYPEYAALPMPKPEEIAVYRVLPLRARGADQIRYSKVALWSVDQELRHVPIALGTNIDARCGLEARDGLEPCWFLDRDAKLGSDGSSAFHELTPSLIVLFFEGDPVARGPRKCPLGRAVCTRPLRGPSKL